jgi:hypothetical protein
MNLGTSVGMATGYGLDGRGIGVQQEIFPFYKAFTPALEPDQSNVGAIAAR